MAWKEETNPSLGFEYLYLSEEDYHALPKGTVDAVAVFDKPSGETRWQLEAIIGQTHGIGVENLRYRLHLLRRIVPNPSLSHSFYLTPLSHSYYLTPLSHSFQYQGFRLDCWRDIASLRRDLHPLLRYWQISRHWSLPEQVTSWVIA